MLNSITLAYVSLPTSRSRTPLSASAAVSVLALSSLVLVTGCSATGSDSAQGAEGTPAPGSAEPADTSATAAQAEGTENDDASAEQTSDPEEPGALTEEQKMQLLLSSEDLPVRPESHSTHSGVSYFEENIAVEYTQYQEAFGPGECAEAMDRVNVDLVGEDPLDGLVHAYSLPAVERDGEEYSPQIYAWALSYDQQADSSGIWEVIYDHCSGTQLEAGDEYVEIEPLDLEEDYGLSVEGISMVVHSADEQLDPDSAMRHSMTVDFGENLVMLSTVRLDDEDFAELAEVQLRKLADAL